MVAIIGLTHMVLSLVDHEMHRITVFEGNQYIRLQLLNWVEAKEKSSRAQRISTRAGGKDVAEGDGSSTKMSNLYEENPSSYEEVNEVCSETELHGHGADGKLMELVSTAPAIESYVQVGVQTMGPMLSTSLEEKSQADTRVSV
jgi:hypothetical protein